MIKSVKYERNMMPFSLENKQIVDMHYIYNRENNQTVLVALMEDGIISSFIIEHDYYIYDHKNSPKELEATN